MDLHGAKYFTINLLQLMSFRFYTVPTYGYLLSCTLYSNFQIYFKNSENLWQTALLALRSRNQGFPSEPLKLVLANVYPIKRVSI